jgi:hypothetical protein
MENVKNLKGKVKDVYTNLTKYLTNKNERNHYKFLNEHSIRMH